MALNNPGNPGLADIHKGLSTELDKTRCLEMIKAKVNVDYTNFVMLPCNDGKYFIQFNLKGIALVAAENIHENIFFQSYEFFS